MDVDYWLIIDLISICVASVALVAAWWFVILYAKEPWRETVAGQHLMRFTAGLAVILTWTVGGVIARLIWPDSEFLRVALAVGRIGIFTWASWMLIERLQLLRSTLRNYRMQNVDTPVVVDDDAR